MALNTGAEGVVRRLPNLKKIFWDRRIRIDRWVNSSTYVCVLLDPHPLHVKDLVLQEDEIEVVKKIEDEREFCDVDY